MLNFDQIFTPKEYINKCISSRFVATILLGILAIRLLLTNTLSSDVVTRSQAQSSYFDDNGLW